MNIPKVTPRQELDHLPRFYRAGSHVPALDGIRGLAILAVMIYHFMNLLPAQSVQTDALFCRLCDAGWVGVDLFFVLSGFLITGILIDTKGTSNYFRRFYVRRALRIVPLYYGFLTAVFVLLPLVPDNSSSDLVRAGEHQAWYWTYLLNWRIAWEGSFNPNIRGGYLWSLAVEEQFYLVWPPLILLLSRRGLMTLTISLLVVSVAVRTVLVSFGASATSTYTMTCTHMDGLLVGALLAASIRNALLTTQYLRAVRWAGIAATLILACIFIFLGEFNFYDSAIGVVGSSLLGISFGWLLLSALVAAPASPCFTIVNLATIRSFGRFSYCIYLIHSPVAAAIKRYIFDPSDYLLSGSIIPAAILFLATSSAACWCLSFISWHSFEKHFLGLKRYFDGPSAPAAAHDVMVTSSLSCEPDRESVAS